MQRIKRNIIVNGQEFEVWIGLIYKENKGKQVCDVYYFGGDPQNDHFKANLIKRNVADRAEGIKMAIAFFKEVIKRNLERTSGINNTGDVQEDDL